MAALLFLLTVTALGASIGDAERGAGLLDSLECNSCHKFVPRWSPSLGPAISRLFKTQLTPSRFAMEMWNHAPLMSGEIQAKGRTFTTVSESQAADLMAWFFAAGYFDPLGDSRRGERGFTKGGCHVCHLVDSGQGGGTAVSKWNVTDLTGLLQGIWGHWPAMHTAMGQRRLVWPSVNAGQMRDLLAFAQSRVPGAGPPELKPGSPEQGRKLFQEKGCAECHTASGGLSQYPLYRSLTELAASFWNHIPMMTRAPAKISHDEMSHLLAFLWSIRYFEGSGNARRGGQVFQAKRCAECHMAAARADFTSASMIAGLWKHPPPVAQKMRQKAIPWPKFTAVEMEDLIAFYATTAR